jgi:hypothetical protein
VPISFVGASPATEGQDDGQLTCNKPAGTAEGDVMIAWQNGSRHTHSAPAGWTQFEQRSASSDQQLTGWYKVAGPSEPSTYNFNNGASSQIMQVHICTYRGVDPANPIGPTNGATSTSAEALSTGSVTGTANCWIISASGDYDSSSTVSTCTINDGSDVERADTGDGVSQFFNNRQRSCACYDSNRPLGATAHSRTLTVSGSTSGHAVIIAVLNELSLQEVFPTGSASTATVGSPAFTRGPVSVTTSGIASTATVGAPKTTAQVSPTGIVSTAALGTPLLSVSPAGIGPTAVVGSPTLSPGPVSITASGAASTVIVGSVSVSPGPVSVVPTGITSTVAFGVTALGISPDGIASTAAFGSTSLTPGPVSASPSGVASTAALGDASLSPGPVSVTPTGLGPTVAFGLASFGVSPSGIASTTAFGSLTLSPGPVSAAPAGIDSTTTVGAVELRYRVSGSGIAPTGALGAVLVSPGPVDLTPTGIAPTVTLGPVALRQDISTPGIASTVASGTPNVRLNVVLDTGVTSTAAPGSPTLNPGPVTLTPAGISPSELMGDANLRLYIRPTGIASTTAVGVVGSVLVVNPDGIPSGATMGLPTVSVGAAVVTPAGRMSTVTFGSAVLSSLYTVTVSGRVSTLGVGSPILRPAISPSGIPSVVTFGSPIVVAKFRVVGERAVKVAVEIRDVVIEEERRLILTDVGYDLREKLRTHLTDQELRSVQIEHEDRTRYVTQVVETV